MDELHKLQLSCSELAMPASMAVSNNVPAYGVKVISFRPILLLLSSTYVYAYFEK